MMATHPALPHQPAVRRPGVSTPPSFPNRRGRRALVPSHLHRPPVCGSRRSVDLAGRSVALSPDIPLIFDVALARHHLAVGHWVASCAESTRQFTRPQVRRHIERTFDAAVRAVLDPVDLADLRVTVLQGDDERPPALVVTSDSIGQLDLGWIEESDAPLPWRAAAYDALVRTLGRVLPVFTYTDLLDTIALYYWDGETDDEAARHALMTWHGADEQDIDAMPLPSTMDARRPEWMIAANAGAERRLPRDLRRLLDTLRRTHDAVGADPPGRDAWHVDYQILTDHIPAIEESSSLPPLTIVPVEQFGCEVDDVGRHGMEVGFMDVAGLYPLPDADRIDDWFASLRRGADFLRAVQDLIRFDPSNT